MGEAVTRRDYEFLARCFAATLGSGLLTRAEKVGIQVAATDMSYALAKVNPRFDQARFLRNAGVIEQPASYGGTTGD